MIYNPGVKSYESAFRKVQNATGEPNQILMLNDGYRASILCKNIDDIPIILSKIDEVLPKYNFEKLSVLDTFKTPWPNGYRDYNCRLKDNENNGLVGELQIHFCPIKFFSQTVGHLSYEILRTLDPNDPSTENVKNALETIATAGYNSALEIRDDCCFDKINQLNSKQKEMGRGGAHRVTYKQKKYYKLIKSKKSKKSKKK